MKQNSDDDLWQMADQTQKIHRFNLKASQIWRISQEELDRIDTEIMSQKVKLKWTYAGTASYCRK